jgi:hypothetical protein
MTCKILSSFIELAGAARMIGLEMQRSGSWTAKGFHLMDPSLGFIF